MIWIISLLGATCCLLVLWVAVLHVRIRYITNGWTAMGAEVVTLANHCNEQFEQINLYFAQEGEPIIEFELDDSEDKEGFH